MTEAGETPRIVRLSTLGGRSPVRVVMAPDADACREIADRLGLSGLRKLRLEGALVPEGRADWRLEARLGATVVQPCVVTLAPVTTRIDVPVTRRYVEDMAAPAGDEIQMPEDDTEEPLPEALDLTEVMEEALALALPLYPRAEGAELGAAVYGPPGAEPLTDEAAKPFAALAALRRSETE